MKVDIYDQYSNIYADAQNNDTLTEVILHYRDVLDTSRYTLVHSSSAITKTVGENLTKEQAADLVTNLYVESQALGAKYDDKLLNLNNGYAELIVYFDDGKVLNRVIYATD